MKLLRRVLGGGLLDAWLLPGLELIVGCVLLVLSASFWTGTNSHDWRTTVGAILGPWFVYRAWKRERDEERKRSEEERKWSEVLCVTCRERAELVEMNDNELGFLGYGVVCVRCGAYVLERAGEQ